MRMSILVQMVSEHQYNLQRAAIAIDISIHQAHGPIIQGLGICRQGQGTGHFACSSDSTDKSYN